MRESDAPEAWAWDIQPCTVLFGRYRIRLVCRTLPLTYGAGDGWGWTAWTTAGAVRKANRKLAAYRRLLSRRARRRRALEGLS